MTHVRTNARFVIGIILLWSIIIIARLGYIQIYQHTIYADLAREQSHMTLHAQPPRACIYDHCGQQLVHNRKRKALCASPAECSDFTTLRNYIATYFPDRLQALDAAPDAHFLYIRRHPSQDDIDTITDHPIADIYYIHEDERSPIDNAITPIIGQTDSDNTGISGLEYYYNQQLQGTAGIHHLYRDARSNTLHFKKYVEKPVVPGTPLYTTIDSPLSFLIHQTVEHHVDKLHAKLGTAIVMDPKTGNIQTLAQVNKDTSESLMPITQTYELGSVIKAFLMTAALEEGVTHPDELIWCENTRSTTIKGMPITTWHADGTLPFADVIRFSNNIGTAKIAQRIGKKLYHHYRACGFGDKTGITFPGEQAGHITPPHKWSLASPLSLSFGYEISASLLQLARAFSIFANDGHLVTPRIINPEDPPVWSDQRFRHDTIEQARNIIRIDHTGSTARRGQIPGYTIFGKTGSAYLITNGTYDHSRSIYTFVGLVEHGDYQRVIVTCVKEPQGKNMYAATVAVPLFKSVAQTVLLHDHQIQGDNHETSRSS